jgi:ubiquinone biosynthesis protein
MVDVTLRQIFIHGFVHADPHPGNLHVMPGNVLCFLDFGMTGFFAREARETLADLMIAVARQDEAAGTAALLKLAGAELEPTKPGLEADFAELIHQHAGCVMGDLVFDRLLQHLFQLTYRHALTLPPEVFTALKALAQIENQIQRLDPTLDLLAELGPFLKELRTARVRPRRILRDLVKFGGDALETLHTMPLELRKIAALLRSGKSRVTFQVEGLNPLTDALERATNRVAFAMVLSSILVASAIVIHAGIAPRWHGIPVFGLIGYASAGIMGALLLLSILRHGRM